MYICDHCAVHGTAPGLVCCTESSAVNADAVTADIKLSGNADTVTHAQNKHAYIMQIVLAIGPDVCQYSAKAFFGRFKHANTGLQEVQIAYCVRSQKEVTASAGISFFSYTGKTLLHIHP